MILIPLRARDGTVRAYALIDDVDAHLAAFRWHWTKPGYAARNVKYPSGRRPYSLHRAVMGLEPGDPREVDHENGDGLDNRRTNLRVTTHHQNSENVKARRGTTSKYRGVCWDSSRGRWMAHVTTNGKLHARRFDTEVEAAEYAKAVRAERMTHSNESRNVCQASQPVPSPATSQPSLS